MTSFSRRDFAMGATATLGSLLVPSLSKAAKLEVEPHYFLHICVSGGMDATYFFDARPLDFTDRNILANYAYKNGDSSKPLLPNPSPITYVGSNGGTCLRSPLTEPLMEYKNDFSVINGVMMSPQFNGHGSNMYYMFTNSPTNGASFMPMIGATAPFPIQSVHFGGFEGDGNQQPFNFGMSVKLDYGLGGKLASDLVLKRRFPAESPTAKFLSQRLQERSLKPGGGSFQDGVKSLHLNMERLPQLATALTSSVGTETTTTPDPLVDKDVRSALKTTLVYFKGNVTRAATIMLDRDPIIDVHSYLGAQNQMALYPGIVASIRDVIKTLKETPFDESKGLSFFDVTTVMVSSEFSRTMRQSNLAIGATGTDHNPYTNTVLLAGKGIKGGHVLGCSDLQTLKSDGSFEDVSGAHWQLDKPLLCPMGRPYDFTLGRERSDRPTTFQLGDYLNVQSVVNSVFELFSISERDRFSIGSVKAPTLKHLMKV